MKNKKINNTIKKLQQDLLLNQQIIKELQWDDMQDEDKFSIEYITEPSQDQKTKTTKRSDNKGSEQKEGYEKARAWHLDRMQKKGK